MIRKRILSRKALGGGILPLFALAVSSCSNNQNQASALLPPASLAGYPQTARPAEPIVDDTVAEINQPVTSKVRKVPKKPEPFILREGETLISHEVARGETLTSLAAKYKTSIRRIQSANQMTDTTIFAGKVYQIPTRSATDGPISLPETSSASLEKTEEPKVERATMTNTSRPRFAPATFDFTTPSTPRVNPPEEAASVTVPPVPAANGSGSAFPTPSFGTSF